MKNQFKKRNKQLLTAATLMLLTVPCVAPTVAHAASTDTSSSVSSSNASNESSSTSTSSNSTSSDSTDSSSKDGSSSIASDDTSSTTTATYGQTKEVKVGDTVVWHSIFTPGNTTSTDNMKDLTFTDPLNASLTYVSAKVYQVKELNGDNNPTKFGADITDKGTLNFDKATNTVNWTPKTPSDFFYSASNDNSTIGLMVTTKVKEGTKNGSTIPNTAGMTLGGKHYQTETPKVSVTAHPDKPVTPKPTKKDPSTPSNAPTSKKVTAPDKTIASGNLAKTGVRLAQSHPIIAGLIIASVMGGLGTWGYKAWKKRSVH